MVIHWSKFLVVVISIQLEKEITRFKKEEVVSSVKNKEYVTLYVVQLQESVPLLQV